MKKKLTQIAEKAKITITRTRIDACEHLNPRMRLLYEKNGQCTAGELALNHCKYCQKLDSVYLCKKKTYTPDRPMIPRFAH